MQEFLTISYLLQDTFCAQLLTSWSFTLSLTKKYKSYCSWAELWGVHANFTGSWPGPREKMKNKYYVANILSAVPFCSPDIVSNIGIKVWRMVM